MYARVVRFTDVGPERIAEMNERIENEGGPPPDVPAKGLTVIVDESQATSVVILFFDSEEDMRKGDDALNAMDAGDTPGTRASVDQGEVKVQRET
jgi:hypothetical protein